MAKKRKTTLLVKLLTKSFYVFWPRLYLHCENGVKKGPENVNSLNDPSFRLLKDAS